jgi:hypothetical protein
MQDRCGPASWPVDAPGSARHRSSNYLAAIPIGNLCLPFALIDDRGLARFRSMPSLNLVFLDGTKITDAGLVPLKTQPNLESVHANGTGVTPSGADAFRARRPRDTVDYGPIQNSSYFSIP